MKSGLTISKALLGSAHGAKHAAGRLDLFPSLSLSNAGRPLRENKFTSLFSCFPEWLFCCFFVPLLPVHWPAGRPPLTCVQQQRTGCAQRQWNEKGSYEYNKIILWKNSSAARTHFFWSHFCVCQIAGLRVAREQWAYSAAKWKTFVCCQPVILLKVFPNLNRLQARL